MDLYKCLSLIFFSLCPQGKSFPSLSLSAASPLSLSINIRECVTMIGERGTKRWGIRKLFNHGLGRSLLSKMIIFQKMCSGANKWVVLKSISMSKVDAWAIPGLWEVYCIWLISSVVSICHLCIILTYWEEDEVLLYGDQVHVLSGNFSCFFHPMKSLLRGWNIVLIKNMNCKSPFTNNPRRTVGFVQIRVERCGPKLISH